ncbi:GNAT family N-acetyltransferase, partial [Pseudomonas otitidis]
EDQLAGYLGTLPDFFMIDGKKQKFAWLSTLYVSEKFRGKKIAQKLLEKAFESYGNNIAITEFTKEAENLYNKTKQFDYIPPKTGKRYYFRTDFQTMVSEKKPKAKPLKPLF